MSEVEFPHRVTATAVIMGLNAALALSGSYDRQVVEPAYVTSHTIPTFSFFESSVSAVPESAPRGFAQEISSVFAELVEGQEPLGPEFEAVWDANVDELYLA